MATRRYVYDFADWTSVNGPIPVHRSGMPKVHTVLFRRAPCACGGKVHVEGRRLLLEDGTELPEGLLYLPDKQVRELLTSTYGAEIKLVSVPVEHEADLPPESVRAGAILEADLEDGSYRSQQIKDHLDRGACHVMPDRKEA